MLHQKNLFYISALLFSSNVFAGVGAPSASCWVPQVNAWQVASASCASPGINCPIMMPAGLGVCSGGQVMIPLVGAPNGVCKQVVSGILPGSTFQIPSQYVDPSDPYTAPTCQAEPIPTPTATVAPVVQIPAQIYSMTNGSSNNSLGGWPAANLTDGNSNSVYSSEYFPNSSNSNGTYVAAWTSGGPQTVNSVLIRARFFNGVALGFPQSYQIYLTSADNSQWISVGNFSTQPDSTGMAQIKLSSAYSTYAVMIVPTVLGVDDGNNHYFQVAEINLAYGEIDSMANGVSNNALGGWPASSLTDGNASSTFSSNYFPTSQNSNGTYIAAWTANGQKNVDTLLLKARVVNGITLGFPVSYQVYLTAPDNSSWVSVGVFNNQPGSNGIAQIKLPTAFTTYGVLIVPTDLGVDDYNNHYFQMSEVNLANSQN